jgi:HEAT repeat protein
MHASPLILLTYLALGQSPAVDSPAAIARQILDDSQPADKRQQLAAEQAGRAGEIVAALMADLPADDAQEEYRRIPWIWRVAIMAGKANEKEPLRKLLEVSLPQTGEHLRDWQAVVIGGGIINGISQSGDWPQARIEELIGKDESLRKRWQQALSDAAAMANDSKVKPGTRYDALRMIALDPTKENLAQLAKYLSDGNAELQMGAVSGLADVDDPLATDHLIGALPRLTKGNQALALDALLRTESRTDALLGLLRSGKLKAADLSDGQRTKLRQLPSPSQRNRAIRLLEQPR